MLLTHFSATRLHPRATLLAGQRTVMVGVQTGEGFRRLLLGFSNHDGEAAFAVPARALGAAMHPALLTPRVFSTRSARSAFAPTGAMTGPLTVGARRLELGATDRAVLVRVQTLEHRGATFGALGLTGSAHLLSRDRAVAVSVGGAQPLNPALDEISLADRLRHDARWPLR